MPHASLKCATANPPVTYNSVGESVTPSRPRTVAIQVSWVVALTPLNVAGGFTTVLYLLLTPLKSASRP